MMKSLLSIVFLSLCAEQYNKTSMFFSLPHLPFLPNFFVRFSNSFSLPTSPSLSLHGRVVINPYFIAGEFSSPCRADSSPRSKTLLGPNPILPPRITPSLPPSGPDYWKSGIRVAERRGEDVGGWHHNISLQERMAHSVSVWLKRRSRRSRTENEVIKRYIENKMFLMVT